MKMDWAKLLSCRRLGHDKAESAQPKRSHFQQDFDRIVFSAPFRRLQDKTQVFPLSETDFVRTRLTHSMEAASIGRSLGTGAGAFICSEHKLDIHPGDVGAIVAAATLAHDIGNPPFGHAGEEAVQYWFENSDVAAECRRNMSEDEIRDIAKYEGNAQGFRILAKLQNPSVHGGMQLTCATLGAFAKYPTLASAKVRPNGVAGKKFNYFQLDKELFREVAQEVGLIEIDTYSFVRHPLAFLVEAADDIAYRVVDFEDGLIANRIRYSELEELFGAVIADKKVIDGVKNLSGEVKKAEYLRSKAIGRLVDQATAAFVRHHDELLSGTLEKSLIDCTESAEPLNEIFKRSAEVIYTTPRVVEIVAAGFELFSGMLDIFVDACNDIAANGVNASPHSTRLIRLIPDMTGYLNNELWLSRPYVRIITVLDYLSGMSDSYAVSLYKKLKGISL